MHCRRNSRKNACRIVIYGTGALAQNILTTGLQLNLYSPNQQIKHHVISQDAVFQIKHHDMPLMDWDEMHYYSENEKRIWENHICSRYCDCSRNDVALIYFILSYEMAAFIKTVDARNEKAYNLIKVKRQCTVIQNKPLGITAVAKGSLNDCCRVDSAVNENAFI